MIVLNIIPAGPDRPLETCDFFLQAKEVGEAERETIRYLDEVLQVEDIAIVENVQKRSACRCQERACALVKITFVEPSARSHVVEFAAGKTPMEAVRKYEVPGIVAECGGATAATAVNDRAAVYPEPDFQSQTSFRPSPLASTTARPSARHSGKPPSSRRAIRP